jgi:hypothetical protein
MMRSEVNTLLAISYVVVRLLCANAVVVLQLRLEAELEVLQQCSFTPRTGRGPQHRQLGHQGLPAAERLYRAHAGACTSLLCQRCMSSHTDAAGMLFACLLCPLTVNWRKLADSSRYNWMPPTVGGVSLPQPWLIMI